MISVTLDLSPLAPRANDIFYQIYPANLKLQFKKISAFLGKIHTED